MNIAPNLIELQDFLDIFSPHYIKAKKNITQENIDDFKKSLANYLKEVEDKKSNKATENTIAATALRSFFESVGFRKVERKDEKGNSGIDLAIFDENGQVAVIIETKKPDNSEMINKEDVNKKAFAETILYYLYERESGNSSIKFIIITDFDQFFVFDAKDFSIFNEKNNKIKQLYDEWRDKGSSFKGTTDEFYEEVKKIIADPEFLNSTPKTNLFDMQKINAGYFGLKGKKNEETLFYLYKFFHSDFLLGKFNPNDANILNKNFYDELLYILGLCEKKQNGKILILPSEESQNAQGTLYYNILSNLNKDNQPSSNEIFEPALEILIIWLNRILFLKLLETTLTNYNPSENLKFLNKTKIQDYKTLNNLFFDVLAQKPENRKAILKDFNYLPYLNSSLFSKDTKKEQIEISELDKVELKYFKNTQIKDKTGSLKTGKAEWLDYLFDFLDAFDFGKIDNKNDKKEDLFSIKEEKILINSSVLGLVFEKLNGYKEGSFYTPNSITSYMCRTSLERVVLEKFKNFSDDFKSCENLDDVRERIKMLWDNDKNIFNIANKIIESIKICDPSVGSGHFLVAALNEMILIKYNLGILNHIFRQSAQDNNFFGLSGLRLQNDELNPQDQNGERFVYKKPTTLNNPNHLIQKCLFEQKKSIIENCLFGVDINPNSAEISRLRLWIELLKNTYYLDLDPNYHHLQTLPNIDINIKNGNSLISRFDLKDSFTHIQNINYEIENYKELVNNYKNADGNSKLYKREITNKIEDIKSKFTLTLKDKKMNETLSKELQKHIQKYGHFGLDQDLLLYVLKAKITPNLFQDQLELTEVEKQKATQSAQKLSSLKESLDFKESGEVYKNAFEWRFEFPEILNEEGGYEGFDLIIGNPPYLSNKETSIELKDLLIQYYGFSDDLYSHFFFRSGAIANKNGIVALITSKTFWSIQSKENLRDFLFNKNIIAIIDSGNPFDEAMVDTGIVIFSNSKKQSQNIHFINGKKFENKYKIPKNTFKNASHSVIFEPTDFNMQIYYKYNTKVKELIDKWWDKIETSKKITQNKRALEVYRTSLKPGDITLLGLITDGGQGLATANNGKYVGVKEGTKEADRIKEQRVEKLYKAENKLKLGFKNKQEAQRYLSAMSEIEIRNLFDEAKEKHGRDIFGQGFIYRIVSKDEIADLEKLSDIQKSEGIDSKVCFVPYDKGDKDGNRWYLPTPYYIAWSKENVGFLKTNSGKKGEGMPVVRNPQFYFKEGFCWNLINGTRSTNDLKFKISNQGVYDVGGMTLFSMIDNVTQKYIVSICNSSLINFYTESFVNFTVNFQINDARQIPILIPNDTQLKEFEDLFDEAYHLQLGKFTASVDNSSQLEELQKRLDEKVLKLYGLIE